MAGVLTVAAVADGLLTVAAATAGALGAAIGLGRLAPGRFAAASYALGALAPVAVVALLVSRSVAVAAVSLGLLLAAPLAFAARRVPVGSWRTARALGASPFLTVSVVFAPPLAPVIGGGIVLGGAALVLRFMAHRTG